MVCVRDVLNEVPNEEDRSLATASSGTGLVKEAMISTTMGDIVVKLFAAECPKTIENFTVSKNKDYRNNLIV